MANKEARNWMFVVDKDLAETVCSLSWCMTNNGYLMRKHAGRTVYMHRFVWSLAGNESVKELDHINGVPWDNRLCNLRPASRRLQSLNTRNQDRESGLPRGVNRRSSPRKKMFVATGWNNGKIICLGYFMTPEEASQAYESWRVKTMKEESVESPNPNR